MRKRTDRRFVRSLGPPELEALRLIERLPGITVAELADTMGVAMQRAGGTSGGLNSGAVRREATAP